jgi:hypothetical protein
MDPNAATELIQATGAVAAVARLFYLNLAKRFPALLAFLAFLAVIDLCLGLQDQTSALYFWSYVVLEPLECVFGILAVRELLALAFSDYPGIRTAGRWAMYTGVALASLISLLVTKRSIVFALAFVIVTILLFLSKYPLHLGRNTLVSSSFFSLLFLSEAGRLLLDSLLPELNSHSIDWTQSAFISICLFCWAVMLRPETARIPAQVHYSTAREEHLLQQLNSLNQLMTRAARR